MRSSRARGLGGALGGSTLAGAFAQEAVGLVLLALAGFAALAVWSYAPSDPVWGTEMVRNRGGRLGALVAAGLVGGLGLGAYVIVAVAAALGCRLLAGLGLPSLSSRIALAAPLLLASTSTIPELLGMAHRPLRSSPRRQLRRVPRAPGSLAARILGRAAGERAGGGRRPPGDHASVDGSVPRARRCRPRRARRRDRRAAVGASSAAARRSRAFCTTRCWSSVAASTVAGAASASGASNGRGGCA